MKQWRDSLALAALLALLLAAVWGARPSVEQPVPAFPLSNMAEPLPARSYSPSPVFADGRTMQPPPAGTVPVDAQLDATRNPYANDKGAAARGEWVFRTYCATCHGPTGMGDGPVTRRGVPAPTSLKSDRVRALTDRELFDLISGGRGKMPPYARMIAAEDRWKAVIEVRKLSREDAP